MTLDDIPLFSVLKSRLGYLSEQQRLISANVANADTPGYTPKDLEPFQAKLNAAHSIGAPLAMTATSGSHLLGGPSSQAAGGSAAQWKAKDAPDSETTLNGNQVVLEEQMMKLTDARMNYDTVIGLYQKSLSMIQLAIRTPGKGSS
jgi:flagellar basal-body rod protein FlgB